MFFKLGQMQWKVNWGTMILKLVLSKGFHKTQLTFVLKNFCIKGLTCSILLHPCMLWQGKQEKDSWRTRKIFCTLPVIGTLALLKRLK
uniref:Putative secreted protein n=1 Tax=Ixodes ricinus TaxID=34613 RepID=A0A6B0UG01_IXORI